MVFGFGDRHKDEQDAYNSFYEGDGGQDYEGSKLHEGIAGAAAFYAMKKYEEKREADGNQDHAFAREMLAAVAGAEVDKLAEKKGMEYEERERAKEAARDRANQMYETNYGGGGGGDYTGGGSGYGGDQSYEQQGGYQQQTNQGFGAEQGVGGAGGESAYGVQSGGYQAGGDSGYGGQSGGYQAGGDSVYGVQSGGYQAGGDQGYGGQTGGYQAGGGGDYQGGGGGDYQPDNQAAGGGYNRGGYDQRNGDNY